MEAEAYEKFGAGKLVLEPQIKKRTEYTGLSGRLMYGGIVFR
jgi:hypothetical protein